MEEIELKRAFALAWVEFPNDPFKAGLAVFGTDAGTALRVSREWVIDKAVIEMRDSFITELGEDHFLPTKGQAARKALDILEGSLFSDDKLKALKLFCDIMGYIEKPAMIDNSIKTVTNKVMIVTDHGEVENWEMKLVQQQRQLVNEAS